jgi:hypothetical protein
MLDRGAPFIAERGPYAGACVQVPEHKSEVVLPHPDDVTKLCLYCVAQDSDGRRLIYASDVPRRAEPAARSRA